MTSDVRNPSAAVKAMGAPWPLIDALMGGTAAMRAGAEAYLPKWPAEPQDSYEARLKTATLFPAYARTVSVLTGKPFSKPITIGDDVPTQIAPWLENVDLEGRNLHAFAADVFQEGLGYGFCGILVDHPTAPGLRTKADEQQAGVRPYFVHVRHGAVLGWIAERVNGSSVLKQLRLLESVEVPDGAFATKTIEQVRVLEPGVWTTYREQKSATGEMTWVEHDSGTTTLKVIPFVPVYGKRLGYMVGSAPMLELAYANVEHWQSKSDQQTILHVARVPILFAKKLGASGKIAVGANSFISSDEQQADVKFVEHSGAAIEAGRKSLLDLEDRMRQTGAELLVIKPGNTTEVQTIADNEQAMCDLQRIAETVEDAIDQALDLMAQWVKQDNGGHVQIYKDFGAATLAEASAELLFEMNSTGKLSNATTLSEMKRRGILSPDIDIETEVAAAKADAPFIPVPVTEDVRT